MKKVTIISNIVGRGAEGIPVSATGGAAGAGVDLSGLLRKSVWDSVFEIKTDANGVSYILSKLNFVSQRGITAFGDPEGLAIGSIYDGLPIDNRTIYWDDGVLKAKGGEGGGGGVADSVAWVDVYGKPSWITENKPVYAYSEILNAPTMPTALSQLANDMGFVTEGVVNSLRDSVAGKQDAITDLAAIRSGASLGATALQRDALSGYLELGGGKRINAGEDLDNYIQLGTYHCIDNSIAVQLINSPTNQAFTMQVYAPTGGAEYYIGQKIENWGSSIQYKRIKGLKGGTWGNWMVFTPDFANYKAPSAVSADSTNILKGIVTTDFSGSDLNQELKLFTRIPYGTEGLFPCGDNANAVLILNRHTGNYNSQFGFNSRGEVYYRSGNTQVLTTQPWKRIAFTDTKVDAAVSADKIETTEWIVGSHSSAPFVIRSLIYGGNVITCNHEGKVGVGTTNLTHTLTVNGTASISGDTSLGGNVAVSGTALISGHSLRCRVLRDGANQWIIGKTDDADGAIGIGSVNSTQPIKLENLNGNAVLGSDGNFAISKNITVGGTATISGNILAGGGVTMYSQRSLKNVVDERGLSLEELAVIKPTRYTWKDGRDERVHIGGIADDVERVMPEVIRRTKDGVLTMDYACAAFAVAASLIRPVSDHERRIGELERENIALREKLELLRKGA